LADNILGASENAVGDSEETTLKLSKKKVEFWAKQDIDHS
jgi:hypothetical protein